MLSRTFIQVFKTVGSWYQHAWESVSSFCVSVTFFVLVMLLCLTDVEVPDVQASDLVLAALECMINYQQLIPSCFQQVSSSSGHGNSFAEV